MNLKFLIGLLLITFLSCATEEKCKYVPSPIFKPEWSTLTDHSFEKNGSKATEKITMKNGVRLELFQTICNNTQQEYHFILDGNYKDQPDSFWINSAIEQFVKLAEIDRSVVAISAWATEIQNRFNSFVLGEKVQLGGGKFIMIDKLVGAKDAHIVVTIAHIVE